MAGAVDRLAAAAGKELRLQFCDCYCFVLRQSLVLDLVLFLNQFVSSFEPVQESRWGGGAARRGREKIAFRLLRVGSGFGSFLRTIS